MAKIENGSSLSGTIGNLVFFKRNGKYFVRSAPVLKSKRTRKRKETTAQWMTRLRFKYAFAIIRELKQDINEWYMEIQGKGSPFHKAVGRVIKQALSGETPEELRYHLDLLPITHGSLVFPANFVKKLREEDQNKVIELTWDTLPGTANDTLSFAYLFLDINHKKSDQNPIHLIYSNNRHTTCCRKDGAYQLNVNELIHDDFYSKYPLFIYAYFRNEQKKLNSDSIYLYGNPTSW